jgi:hypothetical protein
MFVRALRGLLELIYVSPRLVFIRKYLLTFGNILRAQWTLSFEGHLLDGLVLDHRVQLQILIL